MRTKTNEGEELQVVCGGEGLHTFPSQINWSFHLVPLGGTLEFSLEHMSLLLLLFLIFILTFLTTQWIFCFS